MKLQSKLLRIIFVLALCTMMSAAVFAEDQDLRVWSTEMSGETATAQSTEDHTEKAEATQKLATVPTYSSSDSVVDLIEYYEGFREYRYYDAGIAYIGYGSVFTDAVSMFGENCEPLSREQAKQLTRHELESIDQYLGRFLQQNEITVNQNQYDALSDFTYNCGIGWTTYKNSDGTWCLLKQMLLDDPSTWTEERVSAAFGTWVKDGNGNVLEGLKKRRVSETQLFMKAADDEKPVFTDVKPGVWYYDYVVTAKELGIMQGHTDGTFAPNATLTRAQLVQILANYAGAKTDGLTTNRFSDVSSGAWYMPALAWAEKNGCVSGFTDGTFRPDDPVTREQFCTILSRYIQKQGADYPTKDVSFTDEDAISNFAKEHVAYCASIGLVNGMKDGSFAPKANIKRAEAAAIMVRLVQLG